MTPAYLDEKITATKALIDAYETAQLALLGTGQQSYTLDTGQNRVTVTKFDLPGIGEQIDLLYSRLAGLEARRYGGATMVKPAW